MLTWSIFADPVTYGLLYPIAKGKLHLLSSFGTPVISLIQLFPVIISLIQLFSHEVSQVLASFNSFQYSISPFHHSIPLILDSCWHLNFLVNYQPTCIESVICIHNKSFYARFGLWDTISLTLM